MRKKVKASKKVQTSPALRASVRDFCQRQTNRAVIARNNFVESLMRLGSIDKSTAERVTDLYIREKLAKYSPGNDRLSVTHGAFLDDSVIKRAVEMVNQPAQ